MVKRRMIGVWWKLDVVVAAAENVRGDEVSGTLLLLLLLELLHCFGTFAVTRGHRTAGYGFG